MNVLLLSPPFMRNYMRNARCDFVSLSGSQWYPILLAYCGAWLEKCGFIVKLVDAPTYGLNFDETEKVVTEFKPDFLAIYTGRLSEDKDIEFADTLTEKIGCKTIFLGPFASASPERILNKSKNVQLLITGEFELPLQEVIEGRATSEIQNLTYKCDDEVIQNSERPHLTTKELDKIPFVSRFINKHLDIYKYKSVSEPNPFIDIMMGRGCKWGRCTYCLWVHTYVRGPVYNARTIENVIEELRYISNEMPMVRSVMLQDDTLTEEYAAKFSEAKLLSGLDLQWSCYVRGNLSLKTLKLMKKANCLNIHVGFESASNKILKNVKKGITKNRMSEFSSDVRKAGLNLHADFAIGFPGETRETISETIDWACTIRPHTIQFQLMIPLPGTPYYDELKEKGFLKNGMTNYPELSAEEMEAITKKAYRRFYLSLPFLKEVLRHPYEMFFLKLGTYFNAIPAVFWKKYIR